MTAAKLKERTNALCEILSRLADPQRTVGVTTEEREAIREIILLLRFLPALRLELDEAQEKLSRAMTGSVGQT